MKLIRKEGNSLILTPIRKNRLLDLLAFWAPLSEGLPEVEDLLPHERAAAGMPTAGTRHSY